MWLKLPELGGQETREGVMVRYAGKACPGQGCCMVRKTGGAEAGENAEAEIESTDDYFRREAHQAGWDAEIGDKPERSRGQGWDDAGDKSFQIGLSEAVEKEVGYDEIVRASGCEGKRADVVGLEARGCATFA